MLSRRGQNTLEYITLGAFVAAALVIMAVYGKRVEQGHLRKAMDEHGELFAPMNVTGSTTQNVNQTSTMASTPSGSSTTTIGNDQTVVTMTETTTTGLDAEKLF